MDGSVFNPCRTTQTERSVHRATPPPLHRSRPSTAPRTRLSLCRFPPLLKIWILVFEGYRVPIVPSCDSQRELFSLEEHKEMFLPLASGKAFSEDLIAYALRSVLEVPIELESSSNTTIWDGRWNGMLNPLACSIKYSSHDTQRRQRALLSLWHLAAFHWFTLHSPDFPVLTESGKH